MHSRSDAPLAGLTLLSLDAPLVAISWLALFAKSYGAGLGWHHYVLLGLAVWLIYVADRLLDSLKLDPHAPRTERHAFYRRHRRSLMLVWFGGLCLALLLLPRLNRSEILSGMVVLLAAFLYLVTVYCRSGSSAKEITVALIFALGVGLPLYGRVGLDPILPLSLFACLCLLNLLLIALWEAPYDRAQGVASGVQRYPQLELLLPQLTLLFALLTLPLSLWGTAALYLALSLAAGLLYALHRVRGRFAQPTLRALADLCLLTPLLLIW